MITLEQLITFVKNNKKLSIVIGVIIFIILCVFYFLTIPSSNQGNPETAVITTPTPSYLNSTKYSFEKDFKNIYESSKTLVSNNTLLNKYKSTTNYTNQEVETIRNNYFLLSYTNYSVSELDSLFGVGLEISGTTNQLKIKKPSNSISRINLLDRYIEILNKNNYGLVYKARYASQEYLGLSGSTYTKSLVSETTNILATYYNIYLNNNPLTDAGGDARVVYTKNTKTGEELLILPNYLPKNLELKFLSLPDFTTSNIFAFYYDGMGYDTLSYYGPINFEIKDVTIYPNSGSVVYVRDIKNGYVIPYIAKQGRINDEINGKILPDKLYLIAK